MIITSLDDAAAAIAALQRQLRRLEARMQAFEAAAAEPDAALASIDKMLAAQLAELERAVAADLAFEDEQPVRAVGNRQR